jgi:hypothetical protein
MLAEDNAIEIRLSNGIKLLVSLLASPHVEVQHNAAGSLFNCALLGAWDTVCRVAVATVLTHTPTHIEENKPEIVKQNGIKALITLLSHAAESVQALASGALALCAEQAAVLLPRQATAVSEKIFYRKTT